MGNWHTFWSNRGTHFRPRIFIENRFHCYYYYIQKTTIKCKGPIELPKFNEYPSKMYFLLVKFSIFQSYHVATVIVRKSRPLYHAFACYKESLYTTELQKRLFKQLKQTRTRFYKYSIMQMFRKTYLNSFIEPLGRKKGTSK